MNRLDRAARCRGLLASTAALVLPGAALAQSATPVTPTSAAQADAPVSPDGATTGLADIIVTAQRRTEDAQRAGVAVEVVSAEELTRQGVVTVATLNTAVPSLVVTQAGGANTSFYIRGVGNSRSTPPPIPRSPSTSTTSISGARRPRR